MRIKLCRKMKGQATTELAILGALMVTLMLYFVQQGYFQNARQGLEMYTFRQAVKLSREGVYNSTLGTKAPVGVSLTVMRDVLEPSFFSGLNRQTITAAASVDCNSRIRYIPNVAQDLPDRQLIQIGEAMIQSGLFLEVPPVQVKITTAGDEEAGVDPEAEWTSAPQLPVDPNLAVSKSEYTYKTSLAKDSKDKTITKELSSQDTTPNLLMKFADTAQIQERYARNESLNEYSKAYVKDPEDVEVTADTIPKDMVLISQETVSRAISTRTPN